MRLHTPLIPSFLVLVIGCAPAHLTPLKIPDPSEQAEVKVYRDSAFNAGGVGMVFGAGGSDYVKLGVRNHTKIHLQPGYYEFFVRSTGLDKKTTLSVSLKPNELRCFRGYPNPRNYAKVLFPFVYWLTPTFLVEEADCPDEEHLEGYVEVMPLYQE